MTTLSMRPHHLVSVNGGPARKVTGGDVALDALTVPYGVATAEFDLQSGDTDDADPRNDIRAVLSCSADGGTTVRQFDLGVRERDIDHAGKKARLTLATDEAILMDYAVLAQDSGAVPLQKSLRSVVNYVLGKAIPGASLDPGPDFDFSTFFDANNILLNSGFRVNTTGWMFNAGSGYVAAPRVTVAVPQEPAIQYGSAAYGMPASSGNALGLYNQGGGQTSTAVTVTPGQTLYGRVWVRSSQALTMRWNWEFTDSNGANGQAIAGASVSVPSETWTLLTSSIVVPAGKGRLAVYFFPSTATAAGLNLTYAAPFVAASVASDAWFDGDAADTTVYRYDWQGTANASRSTRTALVNRPPELLIWEPGVTAWDFLTPLTATAGFRLFSDEKRKWKMIDPASYLLPGFVRLGDDNLTEGSDVISRWNAEVFATGVVVRYVWTDPATSEPRKAYDAAGTPKKVFLVEYNRPYPGPGAAAAILSRRNGTGRVQDATALIAWSATPAMTAAVNLPNTAEQQGKVSSVSFSLGDDSTMQVTTAGLIEIPAGSIDALDGTIDGLVGTIDNLNPIARRL